MQQDGCYAYTKACGIIGKSFVGKRYALLTGLHSLSDLEKLVFPENRRELQGGEFLHDLEHKITERCVSQICKIINAYDNPPGILIRMLRVYELSDLKNCIHHILAGREERTESKNQSAGSIRFYDIGRFKTVKFDAYPDLFLMLKDSEYEYLLKDFNIKESTADITAIEAELDRRYYTGLLESLAMLSYEDRMIAEKVIKDEICLRNCVCALRLRSYYHKSAKETGNFLMDIKPYGASSKNAPSLAAQAMSLLELPLDSRAEWNGWKWEKFLNPEGYTTYWKADPRYFQNAASQYIYKLVLKLFHRMPLAVSSIFCFIKLKQFEEDILTSIAEGLSLGMDSTGVLKLIEAQL